MIDTVKAGVIVQVEITIKQLIEVGIPIVGITIVVVGMIGVIIVIVLRDLIEEGKGLVCIEVTITTCSIMEIR